ncbi:MAG: xylose isomerase [Novosphingobium sp. 28-62-57]|uniref:sugar phosphate isomerase/epimerase family protein n=1 Tax=unclassified Novosphingobium TaxID=2644732 RepID=UPI000BC46580|nr:MULTISPECIES: TIM barrel protein [unclassified Novosphingobium]OYW50403.1 MAG: xylose isomerase [Novosphingobium sp. 12-62-10]OYZ11492.1 MAG: xylose isomerase [Novosphingobium sp. 28-62-57]OZA36223.1 MAG: xylose isomerase [Novosphingobium sp. 17-62-9]HQS68590.1 TIM barrel protein [Novosphingobium sp.]
MSKIKRGVSLYSFQEEMFLGQMGVEDCVSFAASIGATGIEILPEQNMPTFPDLSDAQVDEWKAMVARHGCHFTAYDMFLDTKLRKDQPMSDDEQIESIVRDLTLCNRLGIKNMRVLVFVRPDILGRCVPYAEKLDVHMGVEVHAPWHLEHAWILRTIEEADRLDTKHLGILPDMGIFMKHYPPAFRARFERQGARPEVAQFIVDSHEAKIMAEYTIYEVAVKMQGNKAEVAMAETLRHAPYANPKRLADYAPYFHHIQAKFYEMNEDCTDPAIAYEDVIDALVGCGWEGTLSSEYEGNRWIQDVSEVDSCEQVRRQHVMFERLIAKAQARHGVREAA